jgi:transposase
MVQRRELGACMAACPAQIQTPIGPVQYAPEHLFDELLYKCRFVIERTNAWLDAFKAVLVRFETNKIHWKALNLLAFCVILLRQL